ncbi:MAG: sulfite exporter TauE/SafE family protein [Candidatus Aminicenantaceae bacterium]
MDFFQISLLIFLFAFICEYIDSSLGMGYGTTLTPLLLIMGYRPLQIVPAVLLSELITGLTAAFLHHRLKNSNFKLKSADTKIALIMASCSVVGTLAAVVIAVNLPALYVKLYISLLVLSMGVIILATLNRKFLFSWKKIVSLGLLASFNKGLSGGGYGPIVTGGQIISGVKLKSAIGITSLAEGLTCLVGVITYFLLTNHTIEWDLAPSLVLGAILSVPLAAYTVKKLDGKHLRIVVGWATLVLGLVSLGKIFL